MKISRLQASIITIVYADVFDFPLIREELRRWLVFVENVVYRPGGIEKTGKYFFLPGRKSLIKLRQKRALETTNKFLIAGHTASILRWIPTIKLVGVTGGLAMGNADSTDDIDLFIIAQRGTLWITRLLATVLVEFTGSRRHPGEDEVGNSICLNMFMPDDHLSLATSERDLFSAHEVLQMMPLWERGQTYLKFLAANSWVKYFLPNAWKEKIQKLKYFAKGEPAAGQRPQSLLVSTFMICVLRLFERPSKLLQMLYMRHHMTTEVVTDTVIRFHPRDARIWVKEFLRKRLHRFKIPLDKVFYSS